MITPSKTIVRRNSLHFLGWWRFFVLSCDIDKWRKSDLSQFSLDKTSKSFTRKSYYTEYNVTYIVSSTISALKVISHAKANPLAIIFEWPFMCVTQYILYPVPVMYVAFITCRRWICREGRRQTNHESGFIHGEEAPEWCLSNGLTSVEISSTCVLLLSLLRDFYVMCILVHFAFLYFYW